AVGAGIKVVADDGPRRIDGCSKGFGGAGDLEGGDNAGSGAHESDRYATARDVESGDCAGVVDAGGAGILVSASGAHVGKIVGGDRAGSGAYEAVQHVGCVNVVSSYSARVVDAAASGSLTRRRTRARNVIFADGPLRSADEAVADVVFGDVKP